MVERVADEMDERVAEGVDHGPVELGVGAGEHELDLLVEPRREVADEPGEAEEDRLDRDHAHLHHHRLQGLRGAREILHRLLEAGDARPVRDRLGVRALDDELPHQVHQLVEPLRVHAHRARQRRARAAARRGGPLRLPGRGSPRRARGSRRAPRPSRSRRRRRRARSPRPPPASWSVASQIWIVCPSNCSTVSSARLRGDDLAVVGEGDERHVGAHRRHQRVRGELHDDVEHRASAGRGRAGVGHDRECLGLGRRGCHLRRGARPDERFQPRDERRLVEPFLAVRVDRLQRLAERVEALEQDVDGRTLEAVAALAQQLEDVLHRVRERRDPLEAHRRAHPLQRVRDPEDLADGLDVVRRLLHPDDREAQLLEVLAALGEEHRQVLVDVHQVFR